MNPFIIRDLAEHVSDDLMLIKLQANLPFFQARKTPYVHPSDHDKMYGKGCFISLKEWMTSTGYGQRWEPYIEQAILGNRPDLITVAIKMGGSLFARNCNVLKNACLTRNHYLVDLLLLESPSWDWARGLQGACLGGDRDLVQLMLAKGAKMAHRYHNYFESALHCAAIGGHDEIFKTILHLDQSKFGEGYHAVCLHGRLDLVKWMGKQNFSGQLDHCAGFESACSKDQLEVVTYLFDHYPDQIDLDIALTQVSFSGHLQIVDFLFQKGATYFNSALTQACRGNQWAIVNKLIGWGATRCDNCRKTPEAHLQHTSHHHIEGDTYGGCGKYCEYWRGVHY